MTGGAPQDSRPQSLVFEKGEKGVNIQLVDNVIEEWPGPKGGGSAIFLY